MKLTSKGQVTIPQKYRERFGIVPHSEVKFSEKNGHLVIEASSSPKETLQKWIRRAQGSATSGISSKQILKMTRE